MRDNISGTNMATTKNDFGPLLIKPSAEHLEIQLPKHFRDIGWADSIKGLQDWVKSFAETTSNPFREVIFDFNQCRWIDPLPLMSLLVEILTIRSLQIPVKILLPEPDTDYPPIHGSPYQDSPNRLLFFLAQEGFIDCIESRNDEQIKIESKPEGGWKSYLYLDVAPSYEDAHCIPIHILMVPKEETDIEFARASMEKLIRGVDSRLESKVSAHTRERLIYKLGVALQETIHNVQEHAYEDDTDFRPIVIYVRYRTGGLGLDTTGRELVLECIRQEQRHCPRLLQDWLISKPSCLEFFVLDRGIGMVNSLQKAGVKLLWKRPFHEVLFKTFSEGQSSKPERPTPYGGLHLLHNILQDTGDFLRALGDGMWFGCAVPIVRSTASVHSLTKDESCMQGLAIHMRFAWKKDADQGPTWAKFDKGEEDGVWNELKLDKNDCTSSFEWFDNQTVIDERIGNENVIHGKKEGQKNCWILWMVKPHRMKWDIINFLEKNIVPLANEDTILIIGDIPSYEAATYAAALGAFKVSGTNRWPALFPWIFLATNRFRFAAVNYQIYGTQHGFSNLHEDFSSLKNIPSPPISPKPENFRLAIVRWIKWHDSKVFWNEVDNYNKMFIPETIIWEKNDAGEITKTINGYLDFPQTTHNPICTSIYRMALARSIGFFPSGKVVFCPLDRLTAPILRELHTAEIYEPSITSGVDKLSLGSILVSGSTLDASSPTPFDIHFFTHCDSPLIGQKASLLFWLPIIEANNSPPSLFRIGRTASIAPGGWKSFEVPRFDSEGKCIGYKTPEETYQDWQSLSPVIVKIGHWAYEGHHDFLTINIASAVEADFLGKVGISRFLASRLLTFIGLTKNHVKQNWHHRLKEQLIEKPIEEKEEEERSHGLLVYRSHPNSDLIINKFLDILTPEGRELALSRIFSILPIRMRWSGSTFLIPPLIREEIREALKSDGKEHAVLLFDDAAITGRTLHDLSAALSFLGANEIKKVVVANRLRYSADGDGDELLDYYWRFDVPAMGQEGNCPLCHALHLIIEFSSLLASTNAKKEIMYWREAWGEASPFEKWSAGLRPLLLSKPERGTRYCYRQTSKPDEEEKHFSQIDIIRSTGLSIHVAELHAMTGRDDYCLKKINEHEEPEIRIELASTQLLLFGNEFDIDISFDLVKTLLQELAKLDENSQYGPLSALAIIIGFESLDNDLRKKLVDIFQERIWELRQNYPAKVMLAYFASKNLLPVESNAYKIGKSLLVTSSMTLAQQFNALFLEILSPQGNAHSEAIPILLDELKEGNQIEEMLIKDALDSLDFLVDLVGRLDSTILRLDAFEKFAENRKSIRKLADDAKCLLENKISGNILANWREKMQNTLIVFINSIRLISDAFFHRIPSAPNYPEDPTFEKIALIKIIDRINWKKASEGKDVDGKPISNLPRTISFSSKGLYAFDNKANEVWVVWHRFIAVIILDIFKNAVYSSHQINDPWEQTREDQANLWLLINYQKTFLELTVANESTLNPKNIFRRLKKRRWSFLYDVGGKIDHIESHENPSMFIIKIQIPYAGYLDKMKEEQCLTK